MKKLMYLFVVGTIFAFTACGGGETATEEAASDAVPADVAAEQAASDDPVAAEEAEDAKEAEDTEEATEETAE